MASPRYRTFGEFFPYYLSEHADPRNRVLHYLGTTLAVATALTALALLNPWLLLVVPIAGYGPAWVGHLVIEKNRPATFTYPVWSLMGDFVMLGLFLTGRLRDRLASGYRPPSS
jgi:hypothetical protein